MAEFDVAGARAEGYSDAEIADYLASQSKFDAAAARTEGYSDSEIIAHLQPPKPPATFKDRALALGAGLNAGMIQTLTLPADTAANIIDIGNATIGAGYLGADKINRAFGGDGVDIPSFIGPLDRKNQIGTSENVKALLGKVGVETAPRRPDDRLSRGLNLAGQLGGGFVSGGIYNKIPGLAPVGSASPPITPPGGPPPGGPPPAVPPVPPVPPPGALGGAPLPAPIGLNATEKATLAAGERLGLKATPGAATGSPQLRQIEAKLESLPSTSGPLLKIKADNARVLQREFLKEIGEQGDEVSAAALTNASTRIGKVFNDAASTTKVAYDNDLQTALAQIGSRAASELTEADLPIIQRQLNEVLNKAAANGGAIDGPAFQNIYSAVGRVQKNGFGAVKDVAGDIREALHDALIRSAGPKVAGQLKTARDQYRVLRTAENSGAIDVGSGSLKAGQLGAAFRRADNAGYQRGQNNSGLYDALRFANTRSFGPIVGDSGTATRQNIQGFFDATKYLTGNLASRAYLATPKPVLNGAVDGANATRDIVRQMLGIPAANPGGLVVTADQAQEEFRRGLLGQ